MDSCERCGKPTQGNSNRYCPGCKKEVIKELRESGYLEPKPYNGTPRTVDQKELTHETKRGTNHG